MIEESDVMPQLAVLREQIEKLERQVMRAGKEQFKANNLLETQQQNWKAILDQLREGETARDRELTLLRGQLDRAREAARLDLIEQVLPVLDGLDEAINAGEALVADEPPSPTLSQRVRAAWRALRGDAVALTANDEWRAWLHGLELVRERLLTVLVVEGVRPIETEQAEFDPHWHHVIEIVAATIDQPAGSIVQETRRGYATSERVLRYAEVVVAK